MSGFYLIAYSIQTNDVTQHEHLTNCVILQHAWFWNWYDCDIIEKPVWEDTKVVFHDVYGYIGLQEANYSWCKLDTWKRRYNIIKFKIILLFSTSIINS